MTETDEKHENPGEKTPVKQGLHGWKAALAMFGCGTLAAFAVFGVIAWVLNTVFSSFSSGVDSNEGAQYAPQPPDTPREEFESDLFDMCGIVENEGQGRVEWSENPGSIDDSSLDGGEPGDNDLVRSDECSGGMTPSGVDSTASWDFTFEYEAVIYAPQDDREELASQSYDEWMNTAEPELGEVQDTGESPLGDEATYFYGTPESGSGTMYVVVVQQRSAVYQMTMSSTDDVSLGSYNAEANEFRARLDREFFSLIPE
ncbi:hypothetical protein IDM40_15625 [Nocardiopsis sp. HNM0947]|uniref:Serine/threonine protein kinase n=1 Tax=Nocardiopsis coralli TaxID=2772213 RepID=A0ABR9P8I2_9ACTN|nr:hypothetical protein [Nocardiopsis coralli]MBE3000124.1 hypothetical protein [Nocardiopsis coralli]